MGAVERFREAVRRAVGNRPVANIAVDAGLPRDAIRYVLLGRNPTLARAAEIADALDLDFRIGPSSIVDSPSARRRVLNEIDDARRRVDQILRSGPDG